MFAKVMLAIAMLIAPETTGDSRCRPHLREVCLSLELMDKREIGHIFQNDHEFAADLKLARERYQELRNAPSLVEVNRLPGRETLTDMMAFNRAYRDALAARLALDKIHAEELQAALRETDQLYKILDMARDARCTYYYVSYRRFALMHLRDMVGPEAFYSGQLPPNVPLWRIPTQ